MRQAYYISIKGARGIISIADFELWNVKPYTETIFRNTISITECNIEVSYFVFDKDYRKKLILF